MELRHRHRITHYFSSPTGPEIELRRSRSRFPRATFMDLPTDIRKRVYTHLGLIPDQYVTAINLSKTSPFDRRCLFQSEDPTGSALSGRSHSDMRPGWDDLQHLDNFANCHYCQPNLWVDPRGFWNRPPGREILPGEIASSPCAHDCRISLNVLLVCRAWSEDATFFFYSENRFKVFYLDHERLSVLESFRPTTLRAMRNLTVRLSMSFCDRASGDQSCPEQTHQWSCHPHCKVIGHDPPLEITQWRYNQVILDWTRLCQRLSSAIDPGTLKLAVIANTQDPGIAAALVEPIRTLPTLRGCSISLSKVNVPGLRQIAEDACLHAMGFPETRIRDPFPFRELPEELQLQVLRHTGLKAPYHLWCDRVKPGLRAYRDWGTSPQCIYSPDVIEKDGCVMCCTGDNAHSAANPMCICWTLSVAPLQVDRKMRRMGQSILYQENTWVLDLREFMKMRENREGYFQDLMRLARHIQIRASTKDRYEPYHAPGQRFCEFALSLRELHYDPSQLTLSLIMLHPYHTYEEGRSSEPVARRIFGCKDKWDSWNGHRLFAAFGRRGFRRVRPKDLFVRIVRRHHICGVGSPQWEELTYLESPTCDQRGFSAQERELEQYIMQDEEYDAYARGKSRAIHEPVDDLPKEEGDLDFGLNAWEPFAHQQTACAQCGWWYDAGCVDRI